ncbi:MAG: hypothetical protein STHCBS139747_002886 [Sporothrix thermara]
MFINTLRANDLHRRGHHLDHCPLLPTGLHNGRLPTVAAATAGAAVRPILVLARPSPARP